MGEGFLGLLPAIEFLEKQVAVYPFAYDWRQDPFLAVKQLSDLVERLEAAGVKEISIVSHSMGGLVANWYLRYGGQNILPPKENWEGAQKISRVVFAGVPFRGVMAIFRNMQSGAPMYWNEKMLQQEAVSSFPSSYFLLPWPRGEFVDQVGRPAKLNPRNEMEWIKNDWGLLKDEDFLDTSYRRARENFTRDWLAKSTGFMDALHFPVIKPAPPELKILNVVGFGTPTLGCGYWIQEAKSLLLFSWDVKNYDKGLDMSELLLDGDETVTVDSAELPEALAKAVPSQVARTEQPQRTL